MAATQPLRAAPDPSQAAPLHTLGHAQPERIILMSAGYHGKDGIARVAVETIRSLAGTAPHCEGWLVRDAVVADAAPAQPEGWSVRYASSTRGFIPWGLRAGLSEHSRTLALVLHTHLAPVALPMKLRHARLVVFLYGVEVWRPLRGDRRHALRCADLLLAISQHTVDRFYAANPWALGSNVRVCPLGIHSPPAGPSREEATPAYALIVGRMSASERYKGHDGLLEGWAAVRLAVPGAQLVMVGGGDDRERLETKARTLGLAGAVRFTGPVSDPELETLYRRCAVFAMPSQNEGFGLVFVEAMRAAKACIAGEGAAREIVQPGVTGLIVPPGDRTALVEALVRLLGNAPLRAQMGQAALDLYGRKFTAQAFGQRLRGSLGLEA